MGWLNFGLIRAGSILAQYGLAQYWLNMGWLNLGLIWAGLVILASTINGTYTEHRAHSPGFLELHPEANDSISNHLDSTKNKYGDAISRPIVNFAQHTKNNTGVVHISRHNSPSPKTQSRFISRSIHLNMYLRYSIFNIKCYSVRLSVCVVVCLLGFQHFPLICLTFVYLYVFHFPSVYLISLLYVGIEIVLYLVTTVSSFFAYQQLFGFILFPFF